MLTDTDFLTQQPHTPDGLCGRTNPSAMRKMSRVCRGASLTAKRSRPTMDLGSCDPAEENNDDADQGKGRRSRGRPRLNTKDETAADRRRTQIRLAQRAYRHRKDTAITTLEQKVKALEQANNSMSKDFNHFYETLLAERVFDTAPHLAYRLKSIADSFLCSSLLARDLASQSSDGDNQPTTAASPNHSEEKHSPPALVRESQVQAPSDLDLGTTNVQVPTTISYETIAQPTSDNATSFPFYGSMEANQQNFALSMHQQTTFPSMPAPTSYASQEVTFGRRLQRTTLEAGVRLMDLTDPPPDKYAAVFGFCLFFESRDDIMQRMKVSLYRNNKEDLSYWKVPFVNLGGAGTFFLDDKSGSMSSGDESEAGYLPVGNQGTHEFDKPRDMTGFSMGPFNAEVETTRDERLDKQLRMMYPGFEGDFFDTDETEAYLRRLGIVIPQSVDYVNADINVRELDDETTPVVECPGVNEAAEERNYGAKNGVGAGIWPMNGVGVGASAGMAAAPVFANGGTSSGAAEYSGGLTTFMCPPDIHAMWARASHWPRARVSIDVDVLVHEIVERSVCLGRAPGVRRRDVNEAVKVAAGLLHVS